MHNHASSNFDMNKGRIFAEWFKGSKTNVCYNALDRWVEAGRGQQVSQVLGLRAGFGV